MDIAALLLSLGVLILVGFYLYAPLLERRARRVTAEEQELSTLMAERDRVVNSLQELDFDFKLGKVPDEEYVPQRASLLQKGADLLKKIDSFSSDRASEDEASETESRLEKAIATRRADRSTQTSELTDDEIESMIVARRKGRKDKSAGFCANCGKPVLASDKFCPSCGKTLD